MRHWIFNSLSSLSSAVGGNAVAAPPQTATLAVNKLGAGPVPSW